MSGLIEQVLPEAVRKHLEVLEIELSEPIIVHAALRDDRWVVFPTRHRLGPEFIACLERLKVTKVELRIGDAVSEFDIEEMVW